MKRLIDKAAVLAKIRKYINNAETYLKYHHNRNDKSVYAFEQEKLAMCELLSSLDTLEVQEEPVSEDKMTISKEWFEHCKKSWYNEGYIAGEFNRGRQFEEPVSDDLEEAIGEYCSNPDNFATWIGGKDNDDIPLIIKAIKFGAKWQKEQIEEALLSEVLPCFMHGGEADEVMAKLDEVLNKKK